MPIDISNNQLNSVGANVLAYGNIVTDGLRLYLDAGIANSYPGSGTTWTDESGNNYSGTLTNGPTYSTANGGGIVFDGTDDYVETNTTNIITGTSAFTVESFFSLDSGNYGELFGNYGTGYSSGDYIWFATAGLYIGGACYVPNYATATQGKHHLLSTRDAAGACITYLDGVAVATATLANSITAGPYFRIGADTNSGGGVGGERLTGKIYIIRAYSRALTASEVLQNFNANRRRFNI